MPARAATFLLLLLLPAILVACGSKESSLDSMFASAAGPTGRGAAAQELRRAFYADKITLSDAVDFAHRKIESPSDEQSITFARAVLDVIEIVEPEIDRAKVNEFFWIRVGTLAGNSAAAARNQGHKLADSLVLAGTSRWQTDSYWLAHPEHDALAALLLHERGESQEALSRLRSRPDFDEHRLEAIKFIEEEIRRKRGG